MVKKQMREATLPFGFRIRFEHHLVEAGKAVGGGGLNFLQSARPETRQKLPVRHRGLPERYGVANHEGRSLIAVAHHHVYGLLRSLVRGFQHR